MKQSYSLYLVDDDDAVRLTLRKVFESAGFRVTDYSSAEEFLQSLPSAHHGALLLDLRMPGMSGLQLLQALQSADFNLPIIVYTGHADVDVTVEAFALCAYTLIRKPLSNQMLIEKVSAAIEESGARIGRLEESRRARKSLGKLTEREREVATLLAAGQSAPAIAASLQLSVRTVEAHRANIFRKLDLKSIAPLAQLVLLADLKP